MANIPLQEVIQMASATPARIMKIDDKKGSLVAGKDADIVIFDDNINVQTTIVNGRVVYNKQ